jgi:hypothetical protein
MSYQYLRIMRFWLPYTIIDPRQYTNHNGLTSCKLGDGGKPLQLIVIRSRIQVQYNVPVGRYSFPADMNLNTYSSGLPTSFHNHLPPLFHSTKCWINNHCSQVMTDSKHTDRRALYPIHHSFAHTKNADTSLSSATLPMNPPKI